MKIDKYNDSIFIRFDERVDQFKPISTFPHYKQWLKVLKYLKKRGFEIDITPYHKEQNWGTTSHKIANKESNGVCFGLECMNWQIVLKFGSSKNLTKFGDFWYLTDNRSKPLSYLETKAVDNEVRQLLNFLGEYKNHVEKLTPEQEIIKIKRESCHSTKKEKLDELGLGGVVYQMSNYDFTYNSLSQDKKLLNCGELKYFYGYDKRLNCGRVYHDLNNRWLVLTSERVYYVESYDLFNYEGQLRRKQLTKEEQINRLERGLKEYEDKKDYFRCISINKQIEKLKATEKTYNVWSLKWNKWWRANNGGYTEDKRYAGVYLESNILANQSYYNNGVSTRTVLVH
jgi:hypothetical protein